MKALKSIAVVMVIIVAFLSINFASARITRDEQIRILRKQIDRHISYPSFAVEQKLEGAVKVNFTVGDDGTIKVYQTKANNEKLAGYVVDCLSHLKLDADHSIIGENFNLDFVFRIEK